MPFRMAKNPATFRLHPQSRSSLNLESDEMPPSAQELSRQEGIQSVVWLLLAALGRQSGERQNRKTKGKTTNKLTQACEQERLFV